MSITEKLKRGGWQRMTAGIVALAGLAIVIGLIYLFYAMSHESTDDAFIQGHIVSVSSRVNGHVIAVEVNDNQQVQAGDLLVTLDPRDFQVSLDMARATLSAAQATVQQNRAQADKSSVEAGRAHKDYDRYKQLFDVNGGVTVQQVDNALALSQSAQAQYGADNNQVVVAQAKAAQAGAAVEQAELNLSYTKIQAPQAGRITNKAVEAGEYITVGQPLMMIVPQDVWVVANFKETQLKYMKPGQPVKIKVDAYSQKAFKGHIDSIQRGTGSVFSLLPPENATGNYVKVVQRVPVKIVFDEDPNATAMLSPGMSVIPEVKVK
jgi:membrane fusion protein (multidrug efflux system)